MARKEQNREQRTPMTGGPQMRPDQIPDIRGGGTRQPMAGQIPPTGNPMSQEIPRADGLPGGGMPTMQRDQRSAFEAARTGAQETPGEGQLPESPFPVRDGTAEDALHQGEKMGAAATMREAGIEPVRPDDLDAPGGITAEKLREAERILMDYKSGKGSVDRRIIQAQEWWRMHNWNEITRTKGTRGASEQKSATGWLWNCIVGKHADAIDSYPEPIILPRMMDDKQEAEMLSDVVPVVMEMNDFEETYSRCQWQKMQEGTAGYGVFWDKTKLNGLGDISIRKINLLNLFWQPGVTDLQDSENLFYVTIVANHQLEGMYPQLKGKLKNQTISISEYIQQDSKGNDSRSAVIDWYYKKWENGRQVLHYCKFVNEEILYSTENNGEPGLYDDGLYPYVLDPLFPVEGQPTGYGYIDIGKDAQSDIDTLNQAMVRSAVVNSTPRHFIRRDGAVNEDEYADWSLPFVHVNGNLGEDSIREIKVGAMDGSALNMLQQKIDELKFITGNTDVQNGGTPTGVTAASAIAALKEDAGRSSKDSTKAAYRAYSKIVHMVIERIRQFYDIPRQFRILGVTGQEKFVDYSNRGIKPQMIPGQMGMDDGYRMPVFDIEVRAQRENAYTKMSQNELALQFLQLGFFNPGMVDQSLMAIDMMEFKGKEEITQKIMQMGTMAQRAAQLGQVALTLANDHEPNLIPQLQQLIAMTTGQQAQPQGGAPVKLDGAVGETDAISGKKPKENPIVTRAKERAQNASRPN